jgi:hypothetical protein
MSVSDLGELFPVKFPKGCAVKHKDGSRTPLTSAVFRETDGDDEERGAVLAKAKGGSATALEELVQLSLTEVNGQPVNADKPYTGFARWNSRARQFAVAVWNRVNGASKEELDAFLAQVGADPAPPSTPDE